MTYGLATIDAHTTLRRNMNSDGSKCTNDVVKGGNLWCNITDHICLILHVLKKAKREIDQQ